MKNQNHRYKHVILSTICHIFASVHYSFIICLPSRNMTIPSRPAPPPPQQQATSQQHSATSSNIIPIKLPPPPAPSSIQRTYSSKLPSRTSPGLNAPSGGSSVTRHFPAARYAPATNWDGFPFDQPNTNNPSVKKIPPPRPPPPRISPNMTGKFLFGYLQLVSSFSYFYIFINKKFDNEVLRGNPSYSLRKKIWLEILLAHDSKDTVIFKSSCLIPPGSRTFRPSAYSVINSSQVQLIVTKRLPKRD